MRKITDPVELEVAKGLDARGVPFTHESETKDQGADFYLPLHKIHIECKQFATPRTGDQIAKLKNVIVIQGMGAAEFFRGVLSYGKS